MKKSYIYLQFFLSLSIGLPVFSQAPKVDRIAIFYMHCKDVDPVKDKLISKKDLEEHYFSTKKDDEGYFLAEDSPIANCLNINTNGLYKYKGNVFTDIKLPFSEEEFAIDQTKEDWKPMLPRIIELLAKQDKEEDQSLKIPGFEAAKYDKVIYLLGEKSLYSTGEWRGYAFMEEDLKTISINNVPVALPSASMKGVIKKESESVSLPYSKKAPDEFFRKEYSEFGLWQYHDITTIHEWGHLLGLFHANMPCNLDNCKKYYQRFCPYSENFFCNNLDDTKRKSDSYRSNYGDPFGIMGGTAITAMLSSFNREKAGFLPKEEIVHIEGSKNDYFLDPFTKMGAAKRVGIVKSEKKFLTSLLFRVLWADNNEQYPTAKPRLFIEYRIPQSYDKHLNFPPYRSNTKGLMIRMALEDVKIPVGSFKDAWDREIKITEEGAKNDESWFTEEAYLLDMSPLNGSDQVTLNPGRTFYHKDWELRIGNVRPHGAKGILFDVNMGRAHEAIPSGVYKTKLFDGESVIPIAEEQYVTDPKSGQKYLVLNKFILPEQNLYSPDLKYLLHFTEPELFTINLQTEQKGWSYTIPAGKFFDGMKFEKGRLAIQSEHDLIWLTEKTAYPFSNLVIAKDGDLKREIFTFNWNENNPVPDFDEVVDLDGDGDYDGIKVTNANIEISENNGSGNFSKVSFSIDKNYTSKNLKFSDIDGDGDLDIFFVGAEYNISFPGDEYFSQRKFFYYKNEGNLKFTLVANVLHEESNVESINLLDIDGDGFDDIILSGADKEEGFFTKFFINKKDGTFTTKNISPLNEILILDIAFEDLDGDGDKDFWVLGSAGRKKYRNMKLPLIYRNKGFQKFELEDKSPFEDLRIIEDYRWVDIDQDGDLDLFARTALIEEFDSDNDPNTPNDFTFTKDYHYNMYKNQGDLSFQKDESFPQNSILPETVGFADLNEDGYPDLFELEKEGWQVIDFEKLYFNDGKGSYSLDQQSKFNGKINPTSSYFTDLDYDGDLDIIFAGLHKKSDTETFIATEQYFNNGEGLFFHNQECTDLKEYLEQSEPTDPSGSFDSFSQTPGSINMDNLAEHLIKLYPMERKLIPLSSDK